MRILILDDHEVVIAGLKLQLVLGMPGFTIHEANTEALFFQELNEYDFDLLIMDLYIAEGETSEYLMNIRAQYPKIKILIYSMCPEELYAGKLIKVGINGYLSKERPLEHLLKAVQALQEGKYFFCGKKLDNPYDVEYIKCEDKFQKLSVRELQILKLLLKGLSIKSIGQKLFLHPSTVGTHKARILEKLGVKTIIEVQELAINYHYSFR